MGIRNTVGSMLESIIGRERLPRIRKAERKARNTLAKRLATVQPKRPPEAGRDDLTTHGDLAIADAIGVTPLPTWRPTLLHYGRPNDVS
jgi:hypothetical protein